MIAKEWGVDSDADSVTFPGLGVDPATFPRGFYHPIGRFCFSVVSLTSHAPRAKVGRAPATLDNGIQRSTGVFG
jgi:hypothetical protein